jgi:trehalose-6-phosphate synthase
MPENERRERMRQMRLYLSTHDIYHWAESCLRDVNIEVGQLESLPG